MIGRAHDLESNVASRGGVSGQPHGGEMAPSKLSNDYVLPVVVGLADMDGMVTALLVVARVLLVGGRGIGRFVIGGG